MNNLNYPLKVSKNKPLPFFRKITLMEQKKNAENMENNLVFCIDPRKAFAIKSIPRTVFRTVFKNKKYVYFFFQLDFEIGFFIEP